MFVFSSEYYSLKEKNSFFKNILLYINFHWLFNAEAIPVEE